MPSVGTPSSKIAGSTCGAPSAYTDAGPPERISATGSRRLISSALARCEMSSEYTRASRTRRAISCEYCPPRSSTSTGRSSGSAWSGTTSASAVIRGVLGDRDVVRVRLAQSRTGDADEARLLQRLDGLGAAIAHRLAQSAHELVHDRRDRALVGHAPLDSFGDELVDVLDVTLEVAVLAEAARLHRAERAPAAVLLDALALDDENLAGRLVGAGEHAAEHHRVRAGGD